MLSLFTGPGSQLLEGDGYQKLPSRFLLQWGGTASKKDGTSDVTFLIQFPQKCLGIFATHIGHGCATVIEYAYTRTRIGVKLRTFNNLAETTFGWPAQWWAIGC
ncbi:MAG: hypothetical protein ON057_001705 [Glomeribacter sp. 1016415]|nr:hypothetical protein [Glomeribacter sp. 1016415]